MRRHSFKYYLAALALPLSLSFGITLAVPTDGSGGRPVPLTIRSVDGPVRENGYIVTFKQSVDAHEAQDWIAHKFGRGAVRHRYNTTHIDGLAGTFNETQIEALRTSRFVESIELDSIGEVDSLVVQRDASWGLQRISQTGPVSGNVTGLDYTYSYDSSAGSGTDIYIVDSGINIQHTDFGGRASWGMTFGNYTPDVDGLGHGTHVAGIAGGTRYGVSKNSRLIAVRVISATGTGYSSDCIIAINWIINQAKITNRPSIINISIKFPPNDLLDAVVTDAVNAGVHVVVSAGNVASDASTQSPARASAATTVGAMDITDSMAPYSNFGPLVDIFAPGSAITSAYITSNTATKVDYGTSMASPFVAGLTAYFIGLYGNKSPAEILNLIKSVSPYNKLASIPSDTINQLIDNGAYLLPGYQQGGPDNTSGTRTDSISGSPSLRPTQTLSFSVVDATSISIPSSTITSFVDSTSTSLDSTIVPNDMTSTPSTESKVPSTDSTDSTSISNTPSSSTIISSTNSASTNSTNSTSILNTSSTRPPSSSSSTARTSSSKVTSAPCTSSAGSSTRITRPTTSTQSYLQPGKWCLFFWWC